MLEKIFWISLRAPYDDVPHAGGKSHNYLIKKMREQTKWQIRLLSFCRIDEKSRLDLNKYQIQNEILVIDDRGIKAKIRKILLTFGLPPSLFEYCVVIRNVREKIYQYKKEGYNPEIIILHWTEIVILIDLVKKVFPRSKIVCIEEDVTFLKLERKYKQSFGIKKILAKIQLLFLKDRELKALTKSDLVVTYNKKDQNLLLQNGIKDQRLFEMIPYFQGFEEKVFCYNRDNILYYGAMNRPENEEAALWFIKNIMPKLLKRNKEFKFIVVGANPSQRLMEYENENVIITGFIDNIRGYFNQCLCMVVPLQMGAGIKIKVLEGMAAGLPILTNEIGIEGIPAENGKEYFFCDNLNSYYEKIMELYLDRAMAEQVGQNARNYILLNYDREKAFKKLLDRIEHLSNEE